MSYNYRVCALFLFIMMMLIFDLKNPLDQRLRWRAYSFIVIVGIMGAIFGISVDSITSLISPDYFIYGKGLSAGSHLKKEILILGAKAGFSGAVVVGAGFIIVNPSKDRVKYLYHFIILPLVLSMFLGVVLGVFQYLTDCVQLDAIGFLGERRGHLFTTVWLTHIGIYLGGLIGLLLACFRIRKAD